ncbi:CpsD/CapB family tyrosine-protein kinase [Roseibacterium sp. SDUM158017]|uniref:CpsD/CapB family tyrosine-protein kinase n=1 Tax=Roseicyclus salinarum TaxID=3036773 RepID=UPI002414E451|nr:CpsD/CapB family tyrosine-protein kinase [Roseibacterium sp. SDUM158017]MDG4649608.1 CpsD/CapB family tyrosine-protein kinase [Roseibacterium sp. SDUM158017]
MEKLQKALQKAREQRTAPGSANGAVQSIARAVEAENPTGLDALWAELTPHEPDRELLDENLLVSLTADQKSTPFDILRTKTQLLMQKNGWSRLGITSATPGCGKTTLACNLALGFARQSQLRVLLIEFDLRRPSISRMLRASPRHDVTEMLTGKVSFADQALRIGTNVAVSMAQRPVDDPTSVLLNQQTHATLARIEETYAPDLVIFDLPPLLVSDDTRAFLKDVDCTILVAKAEATSVSQIDACEREIAEHSNVLGVVINQCRHADDESYYGYSYS